MNVKQAYDKYAIPPNLQKHMLRVAALSLQLVENWKKDKLDKESITLACVFHDMANIIKFNFNKPSLFKEEEYQAEYWKRIQVNTIQKYGKNVHLATLIICREIGLSKKVLKIIEDLEWDNTLQFLKQKNYESAIPVYCDMRIGPHGILLFKDRIRDLENRNKTHDMNFIKKAAGLLEKTLQQHISININNVNDTQINNRFSELLKLEV